MPRQIKYGIDVLLALLEDDPVSNLGKRYRLTDKGVMVVPLKDKRSMVAKAHWQYRAALGRGEPTEPVLPMPFTLSEFAPFARDAFEMTELWFDNEDRLIEDRVSMLRLYSVKAATLLEAYARKLDGVAAGAEGAVARRGDAILDGLRRLELDRRRLPPFGQAGGPKAQVWDYFQKNPPDPPMTRAHFEDAWEELKSHNRISYAHPPPKKNPKTS